jgi:Ca2+-binding EF-hand superfamily protein
MLALCGCALSGAALLHAGSAALVAHFDSDKDGALSVAEVTAMVAATVPGKGAELDALRAGLLAGYMANDRDGDGKLSMAELAGAGQASGS